ncbi:MAG: hypothetical protein EU981_02235 [Candidatus Liberibacter ctenarytainae]|uniref:Uncharacterized protein n=1 Tax=Candidatus Liberibacter ctenarytainae TaxID=2020335 RepID=A0A937DGY2_9HYPH|nr:hypothetical protein [Candidatus Liberibacter ctenarytainae]
MLFWENITSFFSSMD